MSQKNCNEHRPLKKPSRPFQSFALCSKVPFLFFGLYRRTYKNLWLKGSLGEQNFNVTLKTAKALLSIVPAALPAEPFHDLRFMHFIVDTATAAVKEKVENLGSQ